MRQIYSELANDFSSQMDPHAFSAPRQLPAQRSSPQRSAGGGVRSHWLRFPGCAASRETLTILKPMTVWRKSASFEPRHPHPGRPLLLTLFSTDDC